MESQIFRKACRQLGSLSVIIARNQPSYFVLAHDDAEPLFPVGHHVELSFISGARYVRQVNVDRMLQFSLAAKAVNAARPLFDFAGVPIQIMVNNVAAVTLQIDTFTHYLAANKNVGKEWRVERSHEARKLVTPRFAGSFVDIGQWHSVILAFRVVRI